MMPEDVAATGAEIILGNTYHLMLRPTAERVAKLGGLHRFMNWPKPILTDSGGYQVFSLSKRRTINEQGVVFQSHIDGAKIELTPERSIEIQNLLGSNITMVLDECTEWPITEKDARKSMELSMRWAARCKEAFEARPGYGLFGIVQGSMYRELRHESAARLIETGFDGYAVGGLAIGEPQDVMFEVLDYTVPRPAPRTTALSDGRRQAGRYRRRRAARDRYVRLRDPHPVRSKPDKPSSAAAHLTCEMQNIRKTHGPLDAACSCRVCTHYSRAYLHHLIKAGEMLAGMLLTLHNLHYYQTLMAGMRDAIETGTLSNFVARFDSEQEIGSIVSETN